MSGRNCSAGPRACSGIGGAACERGGSNGAAVVAAAGACLAWPVDAVCDSALLGATAGGACFTLIVLGDAQSSSPQSSSPQPSFETVTGARDVLEALAAAEVLPTALIAPLAPTLLLPATLPLPLLLLQATTACGTRALLVVGFTGEPQPSSPQDESPQSSSLSCAFAVKPASCGGCGRCGGACGARGAVAVAGSGCDTEWPEPMPSIRIPPPRPPLPPNFALMRAAASSRSLACLTTYSASDSPGSGSTPC